MSNYIPTEEAVAQMKNKQRGMMSGYSPSPTMNGYVPTDRISNSMYADKPQTDVGETRGIAGDPAQAQRYSGMNGPMNVNYLSGDLDNRMTPVPPADPIATVAVPPTAIAPIDNNALAESAASKIAPSDDTATDDATTNDNTVSDDHATNEDMGAVPGDSVKADAQASGHGFLDFFSPTQGELDAADQGQRWHWALEHRTMLPETSWSNMVQQNVPLEGTPAKQTAPDPKLTGSTFRTLFSMQNAFIKEVDKGNWLGELNGVDPNNLDSAIADVQNDKRSQYTAYRNNLEQIYNEFDQSKNADSKIGALEVKHLIVDLDRAYKPFLGTWTSEDKKAIGDVYQLESYTNNLIDLARAHYNPGTGAWDSPDIAQQFQGNLNNLIDYKLKVVTGSGATLADAAKIRELHSWLSPRDSKRAMDAMRDYQNYLSNIMRISTDKSLNQSITAWLNARQALSRSVAGGGGGTYKDISEQYNSVAAKLADTLNAVERATENGQIKFDSTFDAATAKDAADTAFNTFLTQLTFGASLNVPAILGDAQMATKTGYDKINKQLGHFQRSGIGNYKAESLAGLPAATSGPQYTNITPQFDLTKSAVHAGSEATFPAYSDLTQERKNDVELKYGKGATGRARYEAARAAARSNH